MTTEPQDDIQMDDDILDRLVTERDEIAAQVEPLNARLERLNVAINALQGFTPGQTGEGTRTRNKNVRATVLGLIDKAGETGLSVAEILEKGNEIGVELARTSVSTLVSQLKKSETLIHDGDRYRLAPDKTAEEASQPAKRGRKKAE